MLCYPRHASKDCQDGPASHGLQTEQSDGERTGLCSARFRVMANQVAVFVTTGFIFRISGDHGVRPRLVVLATAISCSIWSRIGDDECKLIHWPLSRSYDGYGPAVHYCM